MHLKKKLFIAAWMICNTLNVCSTLVTLQPVTPSPMLIHAPSFKHTRISTLEKERRSRLGEKLNPQFKSSVSTFDDYGVLIVQFSREKINIFKASSLERGDLELALSLIHI